jgi:hypothetical protein
MSNTAYCRRQCDFRREKSGVVMVGYIRLASEVATKSMRYAYFHSWLRYAWAEKYSPHFVKH